MIFIEPVIQFFNDLKKQDKFNAEVVAESLWLVLQEMEITENVKKNLNSLYQGIQSHIG
jgi:hypothetical protein